MLPISDNMTAFEVDPAKITVPALMRLWPVKLSETFYSRGSGFCCTTLKVVLSPRGKPMLKMVQHTALFLLADASRKA